MKAVRQLPGGFLFFLYNKEAYDRWLHLMYILERWRVIQMLRRGNIFRLVYPSPFFGSVYFYGLTLVLL